MTTGKKVKEALKGNFVRAKTRTKLTVGDSVRIARRLNGLSQNELAELSGLSQSIISGIENNRVNLGVERAKNLARALRVHPAVLLFPNWDTERESAA
jgi:transcriptional regulator with XRE-family HTH domain